VHQSQAPVPGAPDTTKKSSPSLVRGFRFVYEPAATVYHRFTNSSRWIQREEHSELQRKTNSFLCSVTPQVILSQPTRTEHVTIASRWLPEMFVVAAFDNSLPFFPIPLQHCQ
jgi:hypothetical protein